MQDISPEILLLASKIIRWVGGLDNIKGITSGKNMLLSISIYQVEYIDIKKFERASFISEIIFGPVWITVLLVGVNAHEVEMAIKLYEKEEAERIEEEEGLPDNLPLLERIFIFFQRILPPLLLVLVAIGILQSVIIIVMSFNLLPTLYSHESILTTISGAFFYILPILFAFSTAKYYDTNPYVAVAVAGILLHPTVLRFIHHSVLGDFLNIHLLSEQFTNSILPILFIIPFQAKLDKLWDQRMTETAIVIFKPFLLLVTGVSLGVFFFGPLMILIGNALVAGFGILLQVVPWMATALMSAFGPLFVMVGAHYSFFPLIQESIEMNGYDRLLGPGFLMMQAAHAGAALGVAFHLRKNLYRAYTGSAFLLALIGVSQPALYGVEVFLKKPLLYVMMAGGIGGLFAGIMEVKTFGFVAPGLLALPLFYEGGRNLLWAFLGMTISFSLSFFLCRQAYLSDPPDRILEAAITGEQKKRDQLL